MSIDRDAKQTAKAVERIREKDSDIERGKDKLQ